MLIDAVLISEQLLDIVVVVEAARLITSAYELIERRAHVMGDLIPEADQKVR